MDRGAWRVTVHRVSRVRQNLATKQQRIWGILNSQWRRQWHPTPVLSPGKSHGRRSLVGCSPWGRSGSDTTERLHFHFSLSCTGEGNGNPLQCSCLENPKDRGTWWADVSGVAQSGHDWSDLAAAAAESQILRNSTIVVARTWVKGKWGIVQWT